MDKKIAVSVSGLCNHSATVTKVLFVLEVFACPNEQNFILKFIHLSYKHGWYACRSVESELAKSSRWTVVLLSDFCLH